MPNTVQYEVDGSTETHDPAVPTTTACPYLPGQTVNTMSVPCDRRTLRKRSASLNSMRQFNYRTMNPEAKYITPRPAPSAPFISDSTNLPTIRHGSAPTSLHHHSSSMSLSSRSPSPSPVWKRLFSRKPSSRDLERVNLQDQDEHDGRSLVSRHASEDRSRSLTPSEGIRTREMSPESLRRFLSDDLPIRPDSNMSERPALIIPEDIVEENEDDDNFATSAVSESQQPYATSLSPPPFKRSASLEAISMSLADSTSLALVPAPLTQQVVEAAEPPAASDLPPLETHSRPRCFYSYTSSAMPSPVSPVSNEAELEMTSFYDETEDDDEILLEADATAYQTLSAGPSRPQEFEGYSLPRDKDGKNGAESVATFTTVDPPQLLSIPARGPDFLGSPIEVGVDDFVNELGWMVEIIGTN